jgi:phosphatidate cytidylyltransferase
VSATGTVPDGVKPKGIKTGRNLPAAIVVGVVLGGLALLTLLTVKATFLIYMGAALAVALKELDTALRTRDIRIPVIPVALGGAAMLTAGYWAAGGAVAAAFALTVVAILAWRMPGGTDGYVRDVSAGILAAAYLPLLGSAVSAMLAAGDGGKRVLAFIILTICSDIGGYFAGITLARNGGHKMAPVISPKKTWEGLVGSAAATIAAGAILLPVLLHGYWWQGVVVGAAALVAAVVGDLAESMIKRDLDIKDMGTLLPGHGGVLDRLDSLLLCAPVVWLLLSLFLKSLSRANWRIMSATPLSRADQCVPWTVRRVRSGTQRSRSEPARAGETK